MSEISSIDYFLKRCKCTLYAPHVLNGSCLFCSRYQSSHVVYNINFVPYLLSREIGVKTKMKIRDETNTEM